MRLFSVISRTLFGGGSYPFYRGAVSVFYIPSGLGNDLAEIVKVINHTGQWDIELTCYSMDFSLWFGVQFGNSRPQAYLTLPDCWGSSNLSEISSGFYIVTTSSTFVKQCFRFLPQIYKIVLTRTAKLLEFGYIAYSTVRFSNRVMQCTMSQPTNYHYTTNYC